MLRERQRMDRQLWRAVLEHYWWRCTQCGVQNWRNRDWTKPKLQVDHIRSLAQSGTTTWSNLQALCANCNRRKYTKYADHRYIY